MNPHLDRRSAVLFVTFLGLSWVGGGLSAQGADRIVLRNLQIITDRTVTSFDEDGVRLDNGATLTWDEIEKGTLSSRQADFDRLLKDLGGDLYRIRQRLSTGDYPGLLAPASAVYPRYARRVSDTAYMVKQALMWGRLASGERAGGLEPYLRCYTHLRTNRKAAAGLPGTRRLQVDFETALTSDLVPVWFDGEAAKEALPEVYRRIAELERPRPDGAYIYYAALALAAGDHEAAAPVLDAIQGRQPAITELRQILLAQAEVTSGKSGGQVAALAATLDRLSSANQPLAWYWSGTAQLAHGNPMEKREGMLRLLRIPALYGRSEAELSGAALYQVMKALESSDPRGSVSVRRELLDRFGQTYFGNVLKTPSPATVEGEGP